MGNLILFTAALLGVCATASPLVKRDDDNTPCFNATIRKEFLLQIVTYQPYDPYKSSTGNVNQIRLNIADPTNQNQNAITCTEASWNSTYQPFPADYLTCSDPTISYKLTSYTDNSTFSLIINQTFVQGPFSETVLASYDATKSDLNGYACYANGCNAYYQGVRIQLCRDV
jgi:translation elongation factor EF-4